LRSAAKLGSFCKIERSPTTQICPAFISVQFFQSLIQSEGNLALTPFLTRKPIDLDVLYPIEISDFIYVLLVNLRPTAKLAIQRTERQFSARWRREDWPQAVNQSASL